MKIIIVGCGKVGRTLAEDLSQENHDVVVIDSRAERVKRLAYDLDVMALTGNGIDRDTLLEAEIEEADLLIAVTGNDELNMLCCMMAKKISPLKTVARVRNPEYTKYKNDLTRDLGIDMILNPELAAADEIYSSLSLPPHVSSEIFSTGKGEIYKLKIQPDSVLIDLPIRKIVSKLKSDVLVCVVERDGKSYIPDGDFVLKEKDVISVAGSAKNLDTFFGKTHFNTKKIRNVMVVGAGKVAYYLAKKLEQTKIHLTLIESNPHVCDMMAEKFPNATIILGNGSDQQLLQSEGLEDMDAFVSLTGIDEENIILSLYVRSKTGIKTITKINRITFDEVISSIDLDTVVNPKKLTADTIIRYVRDLEAGVGSAIETVHKLKGNNAECLEFFIREDSPVTNKPISELNIERGVLIALIIRNGEVIMPRGNDRLMKGDHVIVVTNRNGLCDLKQIVKD